MHPLSANYSLPDHIPNTYRARTLGEYSTAAPWRKK